MISFAGHDELEKMERLNRSECRELPPIPYEGRTSKSSYAVQTYLLRYTD